MIVDPCPLSIVHALSPAQFGGLESVVLALATAQAQGGSSVCVVPVLDLEASESHPFVAALVGRGVAVEPIVVRPRAYRRERQALRKILDHCSADVIHTHGYRSDVIDAHVGRIQGLPTVSTVHGYTGGGWRNRLYQSVQRRALRRFDGVIAVSEKLRTELTSSGVPADRVHVVQNGFSPSPDRVAREVARERLQLSPDATVIAWVGRLSAEKAPDVLVRTVSSMQNTEVHVSVLGDGPMMSDCHDLAAQLGVQERIRFHGVIPDAGSLLSAFDGLVLTSWTEGTPMVLLEAMAAGLPIVTTAVGGIPDVVSSREALLCGAGDVEALARGIEIVVGDADTAQAMADRAMARVSLEFGVEEWVARHADIYSDARRNLGIAKSSSIFRGLRALGGRAV